MPRVDFYVLPDQTTEGRIRLACRLAEKAFSLGNRVYIHTQSADQAQTMDKLLWTFRSGSFVPHSLHTSGEPRQEPVLIGWSEPPQEIAAVLINLTDTVPPFFKQFERIAELVNQDPRVREQARERFREYRTQGCDPQTHNLNR